MIRKATLPVAVALCALIGLPNVSTAQIPVQVPDETNKLTIELTSGIGGPHKPEARTLPVTLNEASTIVAPPLAAPARQSFSKAEKARIREAFSKRPMTFIANAGQVDPAARYHAQRGGFGVYFTEGDVRFVFTESPQSSEAFTRASLPLNTEATAKARSRGVSLALKFVGAKAVRPEGRAALRGKMNYFIGNDPAKWRRGVATYQEVVYRGLWPRIDLVFRSASGKLKYDLVVAPGAPIESIRFAYAGSDELSLDRTGNLRIKTALGVVTDERPISYQEIGGRRVPVATRFVVGEPGDGMQEYGFALGDSYDPRYPLIIDPGLEYSTFLGGSADEAAYAIVVDDSGYAYVTGTTVPETFPRINFPTTPGAFDTSANGDYDAFVAKLDPAAIGADSLLYSTFLGGSGADQARGIALDALGNVYVTGNLNSIDFPTTPGAFDTSFDDPGQNTFVAKLDPAGNGAGDLLYSTYLGGSTTGTAGAIAVDDSGHIYVAGYTNSADFPTTPGAFDTSNNAPRDTYVTKLDPAGNGAGDLLYSTFLGGGSYDFSWAMAVDDSGNVYVTGYTSSADFPTTAGAFDTSLDGPLDVFVTKLNLAGAGPDDLLYSTFLGGSAAGPDTERPRHIALDASGNIYVTGQTYSADFPTTPGAFDTSHDGDSDAFVTKLNPAGSGAADLLYSTFLGGSVNERGEGILVHGSGHIYVVGSTNSLDFPTTPGAFNTIYNGGDGDVFVTKLSPAGAGAADLLHSTFLGGSGYDLGLGIALDSLDYVYVTGQVRSKDFPTTLGAFDRIHDGNSDVYVVKFAPFNNAPVADAGGPYSVNEGGSVTLDATASFDPDEGDTLTFEWDLDFDGTNFDVDATGPTPIFLAAGLDGPDSKPVAVRVSDGKGGEDIATATVTVDNVAPVVGDISVSPALVAVGTEVSASAGFTDAGIADTHTAQFAWGDSTTSPGTVNQGSGSGSVAGTHVYTVPGVYTMTLTVTDDDGDSGSSQFQFVVVYNPTGAFVTGGGTIISPAGAYKPDASVTGSAHFGFVSKYKKGATVPTGNTMFRFRAADLHFSSDTYQWLVVAGARAQFKGTGTIKDRPGTFGFFLTAIDGAMPGGGGTDKFRIKIWDTSDESVVYDNLMEAPDDADPTTVIRTGSIVIHKG